MASVEHKRGEVISPSEFTIIGHGNIGEKARQLLNKGPKLEAIGFHLPRRTVLAEGFFDGFFQRNNIARNLKEVKVNSLTTARIITGSFPHEDFMTLEKICSYHSNSPLMVRSSGEKDARGTGIYTSEISEPKPGILRKKVQRVLASYFTESAIAFRQNAQAEEGFGVIIEPVIGQLFTSPYDYIGARLDQEFYAPILSGYGFTSTLKGEGYVNAMPGLGSAVYSKYGLILTRTSLAKDGGYLAKYISDMRKAKKIFHLQDRDKPFLLINGTMGSTYTKPSKINPYGTEYIDLNLDKNKALNMLPLFDMMAQMESAFAKSQYFEWAMTLEENDPKYWILQIADVDKKVDYVDFEDYGEELFTAHRVSGSGTKECSKIVQCLKHTDIDRLHRFNQRNSNYVLVFSSNLTSGGIFLPQKLEYADWSNAAVLLETEEKVHADTPVSHFKGQLQATYKFFGVIDDEIDLSNLQKLEQESDREEGIKVYQGRFMVVASEKKDKMVVYITNKPPDS
ncbi:hypothetical protein A2Z22_04205 [Candidatus Woesebacteria bacterium RBG_16_34_12]|uniref:Uncharacterized protein n=1 Tax=Candidatus Woesebacteria bacterium RBG_16_34_12 TaxID=1802480 RepID=A0A1F7X7K5_9BACT|nr:MAG: hypothetical protein A2Z22_04205 [Candidatus Woesebacteria bacterium RBG_16_34_12]